MEKEIVMTYAGLRALEDELEQLKTVKRKEVAEKIKVARGYGCLLYTSKGRIPLRLFTLPFPVHMPEPARLF